MHRLLAAICTALTASSCTATGPLYQEPPPSPDGYAQIVIYRVSSIASGAHSLRFEIDKKHVAGMPFLMPGGVPFVVNSGAARSVEYEAVRQEITTMHFQAPAIDRLD